MVTCGGGSGDSLMNNLAGGSDLVKLGVASLCYRGGGRGVDGEGDVGLPCSPWHRR